MYSRIIATISSLVRRGRVEAVTPKRAGKPLTLDIVDADATRLDRIHAYLLGETAHLELPHGATVHSMSVRDTRSTELAA